VYVDGVVVIIYEVATGEFEGSVQDNVTDPPVPAAEAAEVVLAVAKYGRFVPTSVAVKDVTFNGAGAPDPLIPVFLPVAIFPLSFYSISNIYYADKSPRSTQVFAALLNNVAEDHLSLRFAPGVLLKVTNGPVNVTAPVFVLRKSIDVPVG